MALEREFLSGSARRSAERLAQLLHPDFVEFGRSGTVYSYADVLARLKDDEAPAIHTQDFQLRIFGDTQALLTYRSAHIGPDGELQRHALRASLWQRGPEGWRVAFHQGTPTAPFARLSERTSETND
jgi:hypothetical protein